MSHRILRLPIRCSDRTCYEGTQPCPMLMTTRLGTLIYCRLFLEQRDCDRFPRPLDTDPETHAILRHPRCLELEE